MFTEIILSVILNLYKKNVNYLSKFVSNSYYSHTYPSIFICSFKSAILTKPIKSKWSL